MLFSTLIFVYLFLAVLLILYYGPARKSQYWQNIILTVFSLLFYSFGEPVYVLLMIGLVFFNFIFGKLCAADGDEPPTAKKKLFLAVAVLGNLGTLGFFKYTNFIITNINALSGSCIGSPRKCQGNIVNIFFRKIMISHLEDRSHLCSEE